ncbi:hypothetical protein F5X98DRAFT_386024 [Xylaria grammica]|nr:hypothetical protein F5X98DRAFT_386024 [Xylaria grammica]
MASPNLSGNSPVMSPPVVYGNIPKSLNLTAEIRPSIAPPKPQSSNDQQSLLANTASTIFGRRETSGFISALEATIKEQLRIPREAYIEKPGKHTIEDSWNTYLEKNNYRSSFLCLKGTERSRYHAIIKEAEARETENHQFVTRTLQIIKEAEEVVRRIVVSRKHHTPGGPCVVPRLIHERHVSDRLALNQGYAELSESLRLGPRHDTKHAEFLKGHYKTRFGVLTACCIIPEHYWYLGHRPGDPILRVKHNPIPHDGFNEGDMFYVRDLAGTEDGDEIETYETRCEGVVPFNARELYQRFTRYAFPVFVQMVIAAVGFNPLNTEQSTPGWVEAVEHIRKTEFEAFSERDRTRMLELLRKIWRVKYGIDANSYPGFLKSQVATSISSLREMGWLMSRLERDSPDAARHHYWRHCKGLLQDFTGRDAALLAQEYFDITLAGETEELLNGGYVDSVLVYKQSRADRDKTKLQDLYDSEGPGPQVSRQDINGLRTIAARYLSAGGYTGWLEQQLLDEGLIDPPSTGATQQQTSPKKRKRPESGQSDDKDDDKDDDLPEAASKKPAKRQKTRPKQPEATPREQVREGEARR